MFSPSMMRYVTASPVSLMVLPSLLVELSGPEP
jgi:hypothetical protein